MDSILSLIPPDNKLATLFSIQLILTENRLQRILYSKPLNNVDTNHFVITTSKRPLTQFSSEINLIIDSLINYFEKRVLFSAQLWNLLHFDARFHSPFQRNILFATCEIPVGKTCTYKQIASIVNSHAYRAVGNILSKNPLPILIPCHRVVSQKNIGGFMGQSSKKPSWELEIKKALLAFEQN